jgi:hypothetical protein
MKMLVGFLIGVVAVLAVIVTIQFIAPVQASNSPAQDANSLLPDIKEINRQALTQPLLEAEKTITDPQIASYYHGLLDKCGFLDNPTTTTVNQAIAVP